MLEVTDEPITRFAQEAERRRIARELHDGAVQTLTALVADLERFRARFSKDDVQEVTTRLHMWQHLARESLLSMRSTLGGLRQPSAFDFDLAVETLVNELRSSGYTVTCERSGWPATLPSEYASHLYAIMREALTNIAKHAHASYVTIFLFSDEGRLYFSVGDNGIGMTSLTPSVLPQSGYQQGLIGMRERASMLGGNLTIETALGRGTRVDVWVPVP